MSFGDEKENKELEYEIEVAEEAEEVADDKDESLASAGAGEKSVGDEGSQVDGRKKLSSSEKRKLKQQRLKSKLDEKDALIQALLNQNKNLEERFSHLESRATSHEKLQLDTAVTEAHGVALRAKKVYEESLASGDSKGAADAMNEWYEAKQRAERIAGVKEQYEKEPPRRQQAPDPVVAVNTQRWMSENPWFDPNGNDLDSKMIRSIDAAVAADGYDPRTPAYWDELNKRAGKYMPHIKSLHNDEDDDTFDGEDREVTPKPKVRQTVTSGGDSAGSPKTVKVTLSKERIEALKQSGNWEDPVRRNAMIKAYMDYDKQRGK